MLSLRRFILLLLAVFVLAGCGDEPYKEAYTARGSEEAAVQNLEKTSTFSTTEDAIQLVVQFDERTETLQNEQQSGKKFIPVPREIFF